MTDKLSVAKQKLMVREATRNKYGQSKSKSCLADVRWALGSVGLRLPWFPSPRNTAIENFKELVDDPAKYGWVQVHNPLTDYPFVLIYFKDCGKLDDGRIAGHIAILDTKAKRHYSNQNWPMNNYWASKVVGAFVPISSKTP